MLILCMCAPVNIFHWCKFVLCMWNYLGIVLVSIECFMYSYRVDLNPEVICTNSIYSACSHTKFSAEKELLHEDL